MSSIKGESESRFSQKDVSASEYSISSIASTVSVSQDENFRVSKHAENSLKIMEEYLQKQQLTDVTLIAGKQLFSIFNNLSKNKRKLNTVLNKVVKFLSN